MYLGVEGVAIVWVGGAIMWRAGVWWVVNEPHSKSLTGAGDSHTIQPLTALEQKVEAFLTLP